MKTNHMIFEDVMLYPPSSAGKTASASTIH